MKFSRQIAPIKGEEIYYKKITDRRNILGRKFPHISRGTPSGVIFIAFSSAGGRRGRRKENEMVIKILDGSTHTILTERDFFDLVEERMGDEARAYLTDLIKEATLLVQEQADENYGELEERYEELKAKYKALLNGR